MSQWPNLNESTPSLMIARIQAWNSTNYGLILQNKFSSTHIQIQFKQSHASMNVRIFALGCRKVSSATV